MPAPIRPMPIIPISTLGIASSRCHCPCCLAVPFDSGRRRAAAPFRTDYRSAWSRPPPPSAVVTASANSSSARGLRRDHGPEGVLAPGHLHVSGGTVEELDETARVGATLVVLAGRVQEPRAEAERGGR